MMMMVTQVHNCTHVMETIRRASPPPAASTSPAAVHLQPSNRHQRLLSGARIIKSYVHESELRREASRCVTAYCCYVYL